MTCLIARPEMYHGLFLTAAIPLPAPPPLRPEGFFVSSPLSVRSSPLAIVSCKIPFPVKLLPLLAHQVTPREEQTHLPFNVYNDSLRVWPPALLMTH